MISILNIFNPGAYSKSVSVALLILRLTVGVFMLTHGIGKFNMLLGDEPIKFANPIGLGESLSLFLTVFAEVFCSILLIIGVGTRAAVIPLIFTMLVAAFIVHGSDLFFRKELPLLYTMVYSVILMLGAGKYSFDSWIYKKLKS
jgi:putative oxidoreductase